MSKSHVEESFKVLHIQGILTCHAQSYSLLNISIRVYSLTGLVRDQMEAICAGLCPHRHSSNVQQQHNAAKQAAKTARKGVSGC